PIGSANHRLGRLNRDTEAEPTACAFAAEQFPIQLSERDFSIGVRQAFCQEIKLRLHRPLYLHVSVRLVKPGLSVVTSSPARRESRYSFGHYSRLRRRLPSRR